MRYIALLAFALLGIGMCLAQIPEETPYPFISAGDGPTVFALSGPADPLWSDTYGGPVGLAMDPNPTYNNSLWALYYNGSATPAGVLVRYKIDWTLAYSYEELAAKRFDFPINVDPTSPGVNPVFGVQEFWLAVPENVTDNSDALTGLTFNSANNIVITAARPDPEPGTTGDNGVFWVLNSRAELILGPMVMIEPITSSVSGAAYDFHTDTYWITDPVGAALYSTIVTCCQEQQTADRSDPKSRWLQQVVVRRGIGLEYGMRGADNIFTRKKRDTAFSPRYGTVSTNDRYGTDGEAPLFGNIAAPGLKSPTDVSYDNSTGHIWVLNNFPTTTVVELTPDMVALHHYNLESVTGGLRDAQGIAVNDKYIVVSFFTEKYIAVFDKPTENSRRKDLVPALRSLRSLMPADPAQSAPLQRNDQTNAVKPHLDRKLHKKDTPKSHFH